MARAFSGFGGPRLKDGPGSARVATVSVWLRWGFIVSPSARVGLADLAPRAKVVQTVVCSTFTRGAKPATRRVADSERMNPRGKGGAFAPISGGVEHQGDEHLESGPRGGSRPRAPRVWLRSPRFFTPYRPTRTRQVFPVHPVSSGDSRVVGCPRDAPGPPLAANDHHHQ
jgi:hypothetical protein